MRFQNYWWLCLVLIAAACSKKSEGPAPDATVSAGEPGPVATPKEAPAREEAEPNDKLAQAMEVGEGVVAATLEPAGGPKAVASDSFHLAAAPGKTCRVSVSGVEGEDLKLTLFDDDRNRLLTINSGGKGEGEIVPNLALLRGAYLQVQGGEGGTGGAYRLAVALRERGPDEESEPNDRYSSATPLLVGKPMRGFVGWARDEDWYRLSLSDLTPFSVLRIDLQPVEGLRLELQAADAGQRAPMLTVRSSEAGKGVAIRNLGAPRDEQELYLVVRAARALEGKGAPVRVFHPEAAYTLSVSSELGGEDMEREPNDDAAHAMPVLDGGRVRGYLGAPNDVDWYRLQVERPGILTAELSALPRIDLVLTVVDPEKKDAAKGFELCKANAAAVNEAEVVTGCALQPGENFLRVEAAWKKVDGVWVRDVENLDDTYSLSVSLRTDEGREEREPNDTAERATPIAVDQTLQGFLHPPGDADYYLLDISSQEGPRQTVVEASGIPKLDVTLALLSLEKDERDHHREIAFANAQRGEAREQLQKELMPGKYLILVKGLPANESNTRDQYRLTVSQP